MTKEFNILVIDDEQVVLDSIKKICNEENLSVTAATDGHNGLKILKNGQCHLIICDIMLPDMDGFQFLQQLKVDGIEIPTIMTTGYSTVENAIKSLSHGAIDYLPKPFETDELLSTISRAIKWTKIYKLLHTDYELEKTNSVLPYIPCPHNYYRLGYYNWVNFEPDGTACIGVSDLFLKIIEEILSINLAQIDEEVVLGESCASFECMDGHVHQYLSPLTGRIIKVNNKIAVDKNLIEKDPYFKGWMYTLIPSDLNFELGKLINCSSDRI